MPLRPNSLEDAISSIKTTGLYVVKDDADSLAGKGHLFKRFHADGYRNKTPEGLDFIVGNTWEDTEINLILDSILDLSQSRWGYTRYFSDLLYHASPDYVWFFAQKGKSHGPEPIRALLVQFWLPGSTAVFYERSPTQFFGAVEDPLNWGLLKTHRQNMEREGITKTTVNLDHGGYTIVDDRIGLVPLKGGYMNIGWGTDAEVASWANQELEELPDSDALEKKVNEIHAKGCRTNLIVKPVAGKAHSHQQPLNS